MPDMLPNILQCTRQSPTTKKDAVQNVSSAHTEKPCAGVRVDHLCIGQESNYLNLHCDGTFCDNGNV